MKKRTLALALAAMLALAGCGTATEEKEQAEANPIQTEILQAKLPEAGEEIAVITASAGVVKMRLYPEEAPKAVENFKTLAKNGYYDGLLFHRVIDGFMVQTGDPKGDSTGGESCWGEPFEDEISAKLHYYRGAVAMANAGPNTNGSQFFIVQEKPAREDALKSLQNARDNNEEELGVTLTDGEYYTFSQLFPDAVLDYYRENGGAAELEYVFGNPYTIFGQIFEGMDVIDTIAAAKTDEKDKPLEDITIESIAFESYEAE